MLMFLRLGAVALMGVIGTATYKEAAHAPSIPQDTIIVVPDRITPDPAPVAPEDQIVFRHGDVSWLPLLAGKAGWPEATWPRLAHIILRESGGCPYRRGGDAVDKDCNVLRVTTRVNRSDTGLLQLNGVHWKKDHAKYQGLVCEQMGVCDQETLMDPLTNLKAGYLLYTVAGWAPWDPCQWGPKYVKQCKSLEDWPPAP
jgi:hypothetical protein